VTAALGSVVAVAIKTVRDARRLIAKLDGMDEHLVELEKALAETQKVIEENK